MREGRVIVYVRGIEPKATRSQVVINLLARGKKNTVVFFLFWT